MAFREILGGMLPQASAVVPGIVVLAAESDTTSRDKAITPASVTTQIANIPIASPATATTAGAVRGGVFLAADSDNTSRDKAATPAGIAVLVQQLALLSDKLAVSQQVLHVQEQQPTSTPGGTATSGAWRERTLNTVIENSIPGASLANNNITLPVGTYEIFASAPAYRVGPHRIQIVSLSRGTILIGSNQSSSTAAADSPITTATVIGRVSVSAVETFSLQHRVYTTMDDYGFGTASLLGTHEVYSEIYIKRIA